MQRVSALLPLWEKTKPTDSNNRTAPTETTISAHRVSTSSTSSNRNSGAVKQGRPFKVFSWNSRAGAAKNLSVSPAIANASVSSAVDKNAQTGREAYWPTTLDRECDKAARILKSFCTDGFLDDFSPTSPTSRTSVTSLTSSRLSTRRSADAPASPAGSSPALKKKIPPRVVQEAVGLAIFSCMRSGLWMSGSGGSGILIARKADGTWSPPSGIMLHTSTLAFVVGVDIYDCVLVINSVAALELFTRPRLTLGADVPLTVGPLVSLGLLENDVRWNMDLDNTVLTYVKARGQHRPALLYGSLVTERSNENERFYSDESSGGGIQPIDILDILAGNIRKSVPEIIPLYEAIKAAEGRIDFDTAVMDRLSLQPAPGDADISDTPALLSPTSPNATTFGVPDASDPDPFGIIALEMAGLEIREAGVKHRPSSNHFDYSPSPTSPTFSPRFSRQSADATAEHGSRVSYMSTRTQATSMTDAYTQTDAAGTPDTSLSPSHSDDGKDAQTLASMIAAPALAAAEPSVLAATEASSNEARHTVDSESPLGPLLVDCGMSTARQSDAETATSSFSSEDERNEDADDEDEETDDAPGEDEDEIVDEDEDDDEDDADAYLDAEDGTLDDDDEEEPVIYEVATTTQPIRATPTQVAQVIQAKGALVNITKRTPPPLPLRSPARTSRSSKSEYGDLSAMKSPLRNAFHESEEPTREVAGTQKGDAVSFTAATAGVEIIVSQAPVSSKPASTASGLLETSGTTEQVAPADISSPASTASESATDAVASGAEKSEAGSTTGQAFTRQTTAGSFMSSGDECEREPQTPRPQDKIQPTAAYIDATLEDIRSGRSPKTDKQDGLKTEHNGLDASTTISVP